MEMKTEEEIKRDLNMKIAGLLAGFRSEKLEHHIVMLDWVLNDRVFVRKIEDILKELQGKD